MTSPAPSRRRMTARMLLFTVFCCVSGGPYGLEGLIGASGAGFGLLLILLIPVLWAVPDAMVTAELSAAIPVEGGYYQWVKKAFGTGPAFLNGWWTWIYGMIDASLYPIYFAQSLSTILKVGFGSQTLEQNPILQWMAGLVMIVLLTCINIKGARPVGQTSVLLAMAIIVPILLMAGVAAWRYAAHPFAISRPFLPPKTGLSAALSGGLGVAMWNYLGWDSLSTVAEEVENPQKAFPMALVWGVPLVTGIYVLAVLAGLAFFPDISQWTEGAWPAIAGAIGGPWLFWLVSIAAAASSMALFAATFLGSSRLPFVMAQDGFMSPWLVKEHRRHGTPYRSIILCAVVYAVLSAVFTWRELVEINVVLYATALVMEAACLLYFRIKEPDMPRPFRIPGGLAAAAAMCVVPSLVIVTLVAVSVMEKGWLAVLPTGLCLASGPAVLAVIRMRQRRGEAVGEG